MQLKILEQEYIAEFKDFTAKLRQEIVTMAAQRSLIEQMLQDCVKVADVGKLSYVGAKAKPRR